MPRLNRRPTAIAVAAAALCAALVPLGPAAAHASTQAAAVCTLGDPRSETPQCVAVAVSLDRLPSVGESATVRVQLHSQVPIDRAKLTIRLPRTLRLDQPTKAVGLDQVSEQEVALTTDPRALTFRVTALAAGPAQIEAAVSDTQANSPERSGRGSALVTIGNDTSRAGVTGSASRAVTRQPRTAKFTSTATAGQICARGSFAVTDKAGTWLPARNVAVAVLGKASSSSPTYTYASGLTSAADGTYNLCFTSPVSQMYSLNVRFTSGMSVWQVTNNAGTSLYTTDTATRYYVSSGTDQDFGGSAPASIHMRGWHAFETLNLLWAQRASGTGCWTARETSNCSKLTIHWQPGSTDGTYYQTGARYIALADADPDSEHLVLHESGHAFQHMLWGFWWPASDCPSPHYIHLRSGAMCAWTEGFANAITGYVKGDGRFYWPNGAWVDLMNTTPYDPSQPASGTNMQDGDWVEGRVAGSMIDLWRSVDGGPAGTFDNLRRYTVGNYRDWFNDRRPLTGLDTSSATRDLLYRYTIDYRTGTSGAIVANGGFESGTTSWSITGGVVGNWTAYPAQQGSWYAWMGGNGTTNTDTLAQQITIPSGVSSATLGFYLRIATQESGSTVYDTLKVQVVDGSTTTTLGTWSNVNAGSSYALRSLSLSNYRGKTVTLKFVSSEDYSLQTDFLIDTVGVTTS